MRLLRSALAVLEKDFLLEARTRYGVNTIALFVVISVALALFSLAGEELKNEVVATLMWNTIFFAAMTALQRGFVSEAERGTAMFLALSASATAIFLGKAIYNFLLSLVVNALVAALYALFLNLKVETWEIFMATLFLASVSTAVTLTLISAIVANANSRGGLFAVLSFPILLPMILLVVRATRISTMEDAPFFRAETELQLLAAYAVVMLTVSLLLFEFVWEE